MMKIDMTKDKHHSFENQFEAACILLNNKGKEGSRQ